MTLNTTNKVGKHDLDSETKNKRTAQNRAAQRAFRERKEQKMKELEDKVQNLEYIHHKNEVETEFLRSQLLTLVQELKKSRPENTNDMRVLRYLSTNAIASPVSSNDTNIASLLSVTAQPYSIGTTPEVIEHTDKDSNTNSSTPFSDTSTNYTGNKFSMQFPSPNSSSASLVSPTYNNNTNELKKINSNLTEEPLSSCSGIFTDKVPRYDGSLFSKDFSFDEQFDEQVSTFCAKMNRSFETRKNIIKQSYDNMSRKSTADPASDLDPLRNNTNVFENTWDDKLSGSSKTTPDMDESEYDFQLSPLDYNFKVKEDELEFPFIDTSIAFPGINDDGLSFRENEKGVNDELIFDFLMENTNEMEEDGMRLKGLVNEELEGNTPEQRAKNEYAYHDDDDDDDDDEVVVPYTDSKLMQCSEIWDRITTLPRYSELDIDGLCEELMHTTKCSDKGVLVSAKDVLTAIKKHMV